MSQTSAGAIPLCGHVLPNPGQSPWWEQHIPMPNQHQIFLNAGHPNDYLTAPATAQVVLKSDSRLTRHE